MKVRVGGEEGVLYQRFEWGWDERGESLSGSVLLDIWNILWESAALYETDTRRGVERHG